MISVIANGKTKYTEIADSTGIKSGALNKYLKTLIKLKIVSKKKPLGGDEKKSIYYILDLYFRFWFFFIPRNYSSILSGRIQGAFDTAIWHLMNDYMGPVFETICREYLEFRNPNLPILPSEVGSWWGVNPKNKKECEIDIVITSAIDNDVIIGSCKFRNTAIDIDEFKLMEEYADAIGIREKDIIIFSLSGFSKEMQAVANDNIRLVECKTLYREDVLKIS